ncbi:hypothetical protein RDI58_024481 [Solanum bulbocastanum]|uniref:Amine oxidase domain-containing protein n=1 Tax=Solanum bulbocastanum TaxID=147425 RepID=A0AAN8Y5P3_SOLBU
MAEPSKGRVIVIEACLSELAAARKLTSFGFEVTLLEGRKRVGGRVYKKDRRGNKVTTADLGGIALTGTLGNPPGLLALQLLYTLHKVRDQYPLYRADRMHVDDYTTVAGGPLLVVLVIGEATHKFELTAHTDAVTKLLQILEVFSRSLDAMTPPPIHIDMPLTQGINVPKLIRSALIPTPMMLWVLQEMTNILAKTVG